MAEIGKYDMKHGYQRFNDDLKNGLIKNIILFYGNENYLKREAVRALKRKYMDESAEMFDYMKLDGSTASVDEIINACETVPMISEIRLVIVEDLSMKAVSQNENSEKSDLKERSYDPLEKLAVYFENFPENSMLAIVGKDDPDKRRIFFKNLKKYGSEYEFEKLERQKLIGFIKKRFSELKKDCSNDTLAKIADASGYLDRETDCDLDKLYNDIKKIAAHSDGKITDDDIKEAGMGNESVYVFDFTDALLEKRKGDALRMLRNMLDGGDNEFKLLGMICSQLETLLLASELSVAGYTYKEAANFLKFHEYRMKLAYIKAAKYTSMEIRKLLMEAYSIDRNMKTGRMDIDMALELFIANV